MCGTTSSNICVERKILFSLRYLAVLLVKHDFTLKNMKLFFALVNLDLYQFVTPLTDVDQKRFLL